MRFLGSCLGGNQITSRFLEEGRAKTGSHKAVKSGKERCHYGRFLPWFQFTGNRKGGSEGAKGGTMTGEIGLYISSNRIVTKSF